MKEHTKEPWVHNGDGTIWHTQRCGGQLGRFYREGDAIRIVACVNACAGIPAEQLERGGLEMPLLSTLADIRTTLGVGDKPMLSELAGVVGMTVRHREMAIGALQNAIGMLTIYTSPTDGLAQSGIQALKDVLFRINGGNG